MIKTCKLMMVQTQVIIFDALQTVPPDEVMKFALLKKKSFKDVGSNVSIMCYLFSFFCY